MAHPYSPLGSIITKATGKQANKNKMLHALGLLACFSTFLDTDISALAGKCYGWPS